MNASVVLSEMCDLLQTQVEAVSGGDIEALQRGTRRHEELVAHLETATLDLAPEQLQGMLERIDQLKGYLQSLLNEEAARVDFLLRLLLTGEESRTGGYPQPGSRAESAPRLINRRA